MALTDKPYLPLYVRDWLTSNKLSMCSATAHGVLVNLMCIMHRENTYGRILLKQKFKQTDDQIANFARQVAKMCALDFAEIEKGLRELIEEKVVIIEGEYLANQRMERDAKLSETRATVGQKGGLKSKENNNNFAQPKSRPNAENESNNNNENESVVKNETKRAIFKKPELAEIAAYFAERNFSGLVQEEAEKFFNYYESNGWKVGKSAMKNWQAAIRNWISNYNKFNPTNTTNGKQQTNQHTNRNDRESERLAGIDKLREATTAILNNGVGNTEQ